MTIRAAAALLAGTVGFFGLTELQAVSPAFDVSAMTRTGSRLSEQRLDAIHHAQVWTATDVASMDVKAGPQGSFAFKAGETVTCDYVKRPHGSGSTLKFGCVLPSGRELKVRYGDSNGEVYAQVASTRLLWALGFGANRMYPVKVVCLGCPQNPWDNDDAEGRTPRTFDPATIDVTTDGTTLETKADEGWSWKELDLVDESAGGAPRAQRDALRLLAVLIQHSSNKPPNQRLLCLDGPGCAQSRMMITDVGKTFGRANALNNDATGSVNFKEWSKMSIWKGSAGDCVGNLPGSWSGTLHNPRIGEPGRKFLADLLNRLTDSQLHDLFAVARFTQRDPGATVEDWVTAFKQKRAAIANRTCPS